MLSVTLRCVLLLGVAMSLVDAHGRLMEPPSRGSMWRQGYNTPINWTDDELNCGGVGRQHQVNKGKCGVCGDAWNASPPRSHEAGGKYGRGIITRRYHAGQTIDVMVEVTVGHGGYFEFRVCATNNATVEATQECLDLNLLEYADGSGTQYRQTKRGKTDMKVVLPAGFTCEHCVLQWHWKVANSWGTCPNGKGAMGCGPQETFRGCADIAIE